MNNIGLFTNYRSGSTSFIIHLAEKYGLPQCYELFNPNWHRFGIGNVPSYGHNEEKLAALRDGEKAVFKIMPDQQHRMGFLEDVAEVTEKRYYLYRRNFRDQALSFVALSVTKDYDNNGFILDPLDEFKSAHTGELGDPVLHHIDVDKNFARSKIRKLMRNWKILSELYKIYPGELVCYEDFFTGDNYKPYNRKHLWEKDIEIPDFDVEKLFLK